MNRTLRNALATTGRDLAERVLQDVDNLARTDEESRVLLAAMFNTILGTGLVTLRDCHNLTVEGDKEMES